MSDDKKTEVRDIAGAVAEQLIGSIVEERRAERDKMIQETTKAAKKGSRGTTWNNVLIVILGGVLTWQTQVAKKGTEDNKELLEKISLKQDNAILIVKSDISRDFVTVQQWREENFLLKQATLANSSAIEKVSDVLAVLKTDVAVMKSKQQNKQNNTP